MSIIKNKKLKINFFSSFFCFIHLEGEKNRKFLSKATVRGNASSIVSFYGNRRTKLLFIVP